MTTPIRSWLYVAGHDERRVPRALTSMADAVVLDLEDAVPASEKEAARVFAARVLRAELGARGSAWVRVNSVASGLLADDAIAVLGAGLAGIRVPKVEDAAELREVDAALAAAERSCGVEIGGTRIIVGVETARGIWNAVDIAAASPRLLALSFGAADFARDLHLDPSASRTETLYARSHLVIASRVAGIRPPIESVYANTDDDDGLRESTRASRALGYFGRSAVHPRQLPIINEVFTPDAAEIQRAQRIVDAASQAAVSGSGAIRMTDGEFVDMPIVERARDVLKLASALEVAR